MVSGQPGSRRRGRGAHTTTLCSTASTRTRDAGVPAPGGPEYAIEEILEKTCVALTPSAAAKSGVPPTASGVVRRGDDGRLLRKPEVVAAVAEGLNYAARLDHQSFAANSRRRCFNSKSCQPMDWNFVLVTPGNQAGVIGQTGYVLYAHSDAQGLGCGAGFAPHMLWVRPFAFAGTS